MRPPNKSNSFFDSRCHLMVPATDMSNLPDSFKTVDQHSINVFLTKDRDHVQKVNDGSHDSRLEFFAVISGR